MPSKIQNRAWSVWLALLGVSCASATSVPRLTFEELTDRSEVIAAGQVTRSWSDWDSEHKFIWTHYELSVSSAQKGAAGSAVVISEPGGIVGIQGQNVAGAVTYQPGDRVLVFLQRMPNGYLRTTGWSQGKYGVDNSGHLHAETSLGGPEVVNAQQGGAAATSLRTLDGMTMGELRSRIAARLQTQGRKQ